MPALRAGGSSPGMLWMVMAKMSSVILLQLLLLGGAEVPGADAGTGTVGPSGWSGAAALFLWYASPFSLLSAESETGRERTVNRRTYFGRGQAAAGGGFQMGTGADS